MRELLRHPGAILPQRASRVLRALKQWPSTQRNAFNTLRNYGGYSSAGAWLRLVRTRLWPKGTVLFFPGTPSSFQVVYKLCTLNGYRMHSAPDRDFDLVFAHEGATLYPTGIFEPLGDVPIVNRDASDISKKQVERVFAEVFGYGIGIDPTTFTGRAIRKSNENYTHDGEIVDCPCQPARDESTTYQRYIDTRTEDGHFAELRVSVYLNEIPVVYIKYRPDNAERFQVVARAEVAEPDDHLSPEEQSNILKLARTMGVDYGEMDVMRDNNDGRIYVVDVNRTPAGPVAGLEPKQTQEALHRLSPAFERLFKARTR